MLGHAINQYRLNKTLRKIADLKRQLSIYKTVPCVNINPRLDHKLIDGSLSERVNTVDMVSDKSAFG